MVSWAIFAHLLIGMWAGYLLLARSLRREINSRRPVLLTVRCGTIDETFLAGQSLALGAMGVGTGEHAGTGQR